MQIGYTIVPGLIRNFDGPLPLLLSLALLWFGVVGLRRGGDRTVQGLGLATVVGGVLLLLAFTWDFVLAGANFLPLAYFILLPLATAVWLVALADCAMSEPEQGNDKLAWVIIIVFTYVLGAGLYLLVRRPRRMAEPGR